MVKKMNKNKIGKTRIIIIALLSLFVAFSVNAQAPGDLVIAEVMADPASGAGLGEPANEYFVICNRSATTRDLNGWTVADNGSSTITLPSFMLVAGSCVVVANSAIDLTATGYNCLIAPTNIILAPSWFTGNLANSNDRIGLSTPAAALIDGVSYGSDTTFLNPAAPDVFNNTSTTLIRTGYPGNPTMLPDTDTNADWTSRAGTPCDVPLAPTAAPGTISGRARTSSGRGVKHAVVMLTGGSLFEPIYATTNQFGNYQFQDVLVGQSYVLQIMSGRVTFQNPSRVINLGDSITNEDFIVDDSGESFPGGGKTQKGRTQNDIKKKRQ